MSFTGMEQRILAGIPVGELAMIGASTHKTKSKVSSISFEDECKITLKVLFAKFEDLPYHLVDTNEFSSIVVKARKVMRENPLANLRFGQSIYNNLNPELARAISGTVLDMFYTTDEAVATQKLLYLTKGYL